VIRSGSTNLVVLRESIDAMCNRTSRLFTLLAVSVLLGFLGLSTAADPADKYPGLNLIPWPRSVQLAEGRMRLTADSRIVAAQKELGPLAEVLAGEIALLTGLKLKVVSAADQPGDIVLTMNKTIQAGEPILALRNRHLVKSREGAHRLSIGDRALVE